VVHADRAVEQNNGGSRVEMKNNGKQGGYSHLTQLKNSINELKAVLAELDVLIIRLAALAFLLLALIRLLAAH
jgi:hypothetical protein